MCVFVAVGLAFLKRLSLVAPQNELQDRPSVELRPMARPLPTTTVLAASHYSQTTKQPLALPEQVDTLFPTLLKLLESSDLTSDFLASSR
jgi:hypothetical protein